MRKKSFQTIDNLELIVCSRKSAIIFELAELPEDGRYNFRFDFDHQIFKELLKHIEEAADNSWDNITPKEASSLNSDYWEYYDKEFDSNGYLKLQRNTLLLERPSNISNKLYQFNKGKIESFIYDFRKLA